MENHPGRLAGTEPDEVRAVRLRAEALRDRVARAAREGRTPGLRVLVGTEEVTAELGVLEANARRTVWNMQPRYYFDPEEPGLDLTGSADVRGVTTALVTRPITRKVHPLLPSLFPQALVGPAFLQCIVVDEERVLVEGPDTADGDVTVCVTSRLDYLESAVELWQRTVAISTPLVPPGVEPPLTRRQVRVARLLALGEKDRAIARALHTSPRTVERDVHAVLAELGARSRTEAVLLMRGRAATGARPVLRDNS